MKVIYLFSRWLLAVSFLSIVSANGAVFIKIGDIKGESQAAGHEEEIDVLSWSWGVTRPDTGETGETRRRGAPQVIDLSISKVLEKATPKLVEACVTGKVFPEATLVVERPGQAGNVKIFEIVLSNVLITADNLTGSVEAIENVSLNYEEIEMRYFVQNQDGSPGGTVEMSYQVELGE